MNKDAASGTQAGAPVDTRRRIFRRSPWENASAAVIGAGLVMLMQPLSIELYTWSFEVILLGTVAFIVTSHFPE
jgi:hypothetical protein